RLFDQLIPLPHGTTYNSYLVRGSEKTALLDTVDPETMDLLFAHLDRLGVKKLDYVISHHAEQDHSGTLPMVVERYGCQVVTNKKCKGMLLDLLDLKDEQIVEVEDGEKLSLGNKTLEFLLLPWVHWPETMGTWLAEDRILFSCDFFGSHLASTQLFADDKMMVYEPAKRYFAEIMMPFRTQIRKNLAKIEGLGIEMIAPSHGPVYREPAFIMDAYRDWVSDEVKNEVVLAYVSMHGSTERMAERLTDALMRRGINVHRFDIPVTDLGNLAVSLVDAATVIVGAPTVLTGPHPMAAYAAMLVGALRPKTKFAGIFGSYGWAGKMPEQLTQMLSPVRAELFEPVISKGHPKEEDLKRLDELADQILAKHRGIGIAG
ncbi:MAG: FprA family A-type flavoprotein, partial [Phycisphaerae bacterium]|nr:FprA family A-type flavoprotein [Phycisphaerae bacterium]